MAKEITYHKVTVKMKHGFTYSYTIMGRFLESMKKASDGYWTESITSEEITESDHIIFWSVGLEDDPKPKRNVTKTEDKILRNAVKKSGKVVSEGKFVPKFSSLENFFDEPPKKKRK